MATKKPATIGFSIIGSSGNTSYFQTDGLFLKSDIQSQSVDLFTRTKPTGISIPFETNWNPKLNSIDLNSSLITDDVSSGQMSIYWKDFSSNVDDAFYTTHQGQIGVDYYVDADWKISDIDMSADIMAIGTSDWTSQEKIILDTPITRNISVKSIVTGKYDRQEVGQPTLYPVQYNNQTVYTAIIGWDSNGAGNRAGTLTFTGFDLSSPSPYVFNVPHGDADTIYLDTTSWPPPTYTWVWQGGGTSYDPVGAWPPPYNSQILPVQEPIPDGAIQIGAYYYFPQYNYVPKAFKPIKSTVYPNNDFKIYKYDAVFNSGVTCPCSGNPKSAIVKSKMFTFWGKYKSSVIPQFVERLRAIDDSRGIVTSQDTVTYSYEICNPVSGNYVSGIVSNLSPITGGNGDYVYNDLALATPELFIDGIQYNFFDCFTINKYSPTDVPSFTIPEINQAAPPGSIYMRNSLGESYSPPLNIKTSNFILTNAHLLLDEYPYTASIYPDPNLKNIEYFDYSDIFFEVKYSLPTTESGCQGIDNKLAASYIAYEPPVKTDVTPETRTKVYRFDGTITTDQFLEGNTNLSQDFNVANDNDPTWKILLAPTNRVIGVVLSSYVNWRPSSTTHVTNQYPPSGNFILEDNFTQFSTFDNTPPIKTYEGLYGIIAQKDIAIDEVKVYKMVNFPNCGKVDLYYKNTGGINSISGNDITYRSHGLTTGDRIKMVGVTSDTLQTNLNDTFYVGVKTDNVFNLYSDQDLLNIVTPSNIKSYAGAVWTAIGGKSWKYNSTIYSPMGKNGYSCDVPQLILNHEMLNSGIYERTVYVDDSKSDQVRLNYWPDRQNYPQGFFNGSTSFNNFYPYKRYGDNSTFILDIVNGNRFGDTIKIKKLDDSNHILMVTEPGAMESFEAVDNKSPGVKNKKVLPTYLPYGRIHFFNIPKPPRGYVGLQAINLITYLGSVSQQGNPWNPIEVANLNYRKANPDSAYKSTVDGLDVKTYTPTGPNANYWYGSRFASWTKDTIYNSSYSYDMPNVDAYPKEYGYLDYLGKSADFIINKNDNVLYCAASTNVKNADFLRNSRINYPDANLQVFTFDLNTNAISGSLQTISASSVASTTSYLDQQNEIINFAECVKLTDAQRLYFGWPGTTRGYDNIYYYQKSGDQYGLKQIVTGDGMYGLGRYLSVNDDYLVANQRSYYDDNNNLTTNPLDYILTYKYYSKMDRYVPVSRLSTTIDTTNPQYQNLNIDEYEVTTNLSYDNTSGNSATYIMDLTGKFDLHNDELFVRDWYEISRFKFDSDTQTFRNNFHKVVYSSGTILNTSDAILRVRESNAPATFDKTSEIADGHFARALEIVDGSQYFNGSYVNYLSTFDVQDLNYLPLYLQTSLPANKKQELFTKGMAYASGNANMFLEVAKPSSGLMDLYVELPVKRQSNDLVSKGHIRFNSNINLTMWQNTWNSGITLHTYYDPRFSGYMPLSVAIPTVVGREDYVDEFGNPVTNIIYDDVVQLYLESYYTGVPNASSNMPVYLQTIEYDDYASSMSLGINTTLTPSNSSSSGNITTYIASSGMPSGYNSVQLSVSGSMNKSDTYMPLFINRPIVGIVPLVVYNTISATGIPLFTSGDRVAVTGLNLIMGSGHGYINKKVNMFTRGSTN